MDRGPFVDPIIAGNQCRRPFTPGHRSTRTAIELGGPFKATGPHDISERAATRADMAAENRVPSVSSQKNGTIQLKPLADVIGDIFVTSCCDPQTRNTIANVFEAGVMATHDRQEPTPGRVLSSGLILVQYRACQPSQRLPGSHPLHQWPKEYNRTSHIRLGN